MLDATIFIGALDGFTEALGRDRQNAVTPLHIQATANRWGSDSIGFDLRRRGGQSWPDIAGGAPLDFHVGGVPVWSGSVKETPSRTGDEDVISVAGEGWQYHLDEDVINKKYVHSDLTDWRDCRSFLTTTINRVGMAAGQVTTDRGAITIGWSKGAQIAGASAAAVGVTLDLGPSNTAKRVVIDWTKIGATAVAGLINLVIRGHDGEDGVNPGSFENALNADVTTLGASGTTAFTFTTARRYVTIALFYINGANTTYGEDNLFRITAAKVFAATAYESGNASIFKASTGITDVLGLGATPLLSTDLSAIAATSFNLPEFALDGYHSPREVIDALNAYHAWLTQIDVEKRMVFQPLPTAPTYEIGGWSGADFKDSSLNTLDEIYNKVIVQAQGPDGADLSTTRTQSVPLLTKRGRNRTKILQVSSRLNTASANQIGDTFLAIHKTTPFKGSVDVASDRGIRHVLNGTAVHPSLLLRNGGQLLRVAHVLNPDTGDIGRDGTMVQVSYDHDGQHAGVQLDDTRNNFEAFLSRLAVVTG